MSEFILEGPSDPGSLPQVSLGIIYYNAFLKREDAKTLIVDSTNEEITNEKFFTLCIKLAKIFKKLGVNKNDVITIISHSHWKYVATIIAGFFVGATMNLYNFSYTTGELKHFLSMCKPKFIFCTTTTFKHLEPLQETLLLPDNIISYDNEVSGSVINFDDFLQEASDHEPFTPVNVNPEKDVAVILTSSGTTGLPKLVQLTHSNIRTLLTVFGDPNFMDFNETDSLIGYLPLFHISGFGIALASILYGSKSVILEKFKPESFLLIIQQHKITKLLVVPATLLFLVKSPLVKKYDLSSVKTIMFGAAPATKELAEMVSQQLKIEDLRQMYGMTETSLMVTITPKSKKNYDSCGKLVTPCWAKVCDFQTGKPLPSYKRGELRFKGGGVMKGYLGLEAETVDAFDEEGYLKSGDVGYYDNEGYFYIEGRLKEIIKYKGFQVSPAEIENLLIQHPSVKDVGVVGKPDSRAGEVPVALVVRQLNHNVTEKELINYVAEKLSIQKHLHGGVKFIDEIPKNATGKILRNKLKELL